MNISLLAVVTIAMVICNTQTTKVNSLKFYNVAANHLFKQIKTDLNRLQSFMQDVVKGKCDGVKATDGPRGAVYTRWGHKLCPGSETSLVYSGYTGGSYYKHTGGAAEYICLPRNPTKSTDNTKYRSVGYVYGTEYEIPGHKNYDVPCAVCQSMSRPNSIMLPGRDICPDGWYREYKGHLMTGYYGHKGASQYVCVDKARKALNGSHRNNNGKLLYPATARCGSLQCPPYTQNQLLTCAVCTR